LSRCVSVSVFLFVVVTAVYFLPLVRCFLVAESEVEFFPSHVARTAVLLCLCCQREGNRAFVSGCLFAVF